MLAQRMFKARQHARKAGGEEWRAMPSDICAEMLRSWCCACYMRIARSCAQARECAVLLMRRRAMRARADACAIG